ncbi:hypothetical protein CTRI78_v010475 [Colletotrichum trifolii]|uniref:Alpha-L-rhamnosidase C-terminal domain-containing protein n=1 Tax=Colletotrichum trifolii TaxID=5466 RepID=A0A4R8QL34_COLTR|nr:hypothetical protein CTRI78_v010475 [Colletotrichum trifolii]
MSHSPITAKHVLSTTGDAQHDPDSIIFSLANDAVTETSPQASIIFDYGQCFGGLPVLVVDKARGNRPIRLQAVYSETIEGIACETGDGPFFLFSSAMDSYRNVSISVLPSESQQVIKARLAQKSQRYLKLVLVSPDSSVTISQAGLESCRPSITPKAHFACSSDVLNRIWQDGVRTIDMCTVLKGETLPSWDVADIGTKVSGQHWAPCRQGTRWGDKEVTFQVLVDRVGASWGVHMVANGVVFCLDVERQELRAYEGLAHQSAVFPVKSFGSWSARTMAKRGDWIDVCVVTSGSRVTVSINGKEIATLADVRVRPLLGGSGINTGSVAFGGPEGWVAVYRNLVVRDPSGSTLYENGMCLKDKDRVLADFQVGTNVVSCMIDGAKRDRATFGGDLFVSGRGVAYAGLDLDAVAGSIELLASHQTEDGYLGNLCPIQAPIHTGEEPPPTYAFYSITYAFLLVVAAKDYWLHSGDDELVRRLLPAMDRLLDFGASQLNSMGLIEAHPELSMHWYPLGGPVFGASGTANLAYYDALKAAETLTTDASEKHVLSLRADELKRNILAHLLNQETGSVRMGTALPSDGICQDTNGYAVSLNIIPEPLDTTSHLKCPSETRPVAFKGLNHWDKTGVVSPYATGFAAEALFSQGKGHEAIELMESVWGPMADPSNPNYSGGHWEAMTTDGKPFGHDTSLMHAWSSWPVFLLPQYLTGLKPTEAGWEKVQIAPVVSGVDFARYTVDTPRGTFEVEMRLDGAAETLSLAVTLPAGVSATVIPPFGFLAGSEAEALLQGPAKKTFHFTDKR